MIFIVGFTHYGEGWFGGNPEYKFIELHEGINGFSKNHINDIELMQYIGLKDKNKVEIYEGDIVETSTGKPMCISWDNKRATFVIDRVGWAFRHYFGEAMNADDCEVIGNIYQNPQLLENLMKAQPNKAHLPVKTAKEILYKKASEKNDGFLPGQVAWIVEAMKDYAKQSIEECSNRAELDDELQ